MKMRKWLLVASALLPIFTTNCTKKKKSTESNPPTPDLIEEQKPKPENQDQQGTDNTKTGTPVVDKPIDPPIVSNFFFDKYAGNYETVANTTVSQGASLAGYRSANLGVFYQWSRMAVMSPQEGFSAQVNIGTTDNVSLVNMRITRNVNGAPQTIRPVFTFSDCVKKLNTRYCYLDKTRFQVDVNGMGYFVGDLNTSLMLDDRFSQPRTYAFAAGDSSFTDRIGERLEITDLNNGMLHFIVLSSSLAGIRHSTEVEIVLDFQVVKMKP